MRRISLSRSRLVSARPRPSSGRVNRPWKFSRETLQALFETYGSVIKVGIDQEKLIELVEQNVAASETPALRKISVREQVASVNFLMHKRLHTYHQAVVNPFVRLQTAKYEEHRKKGEPSPGSNVREFWNKALSKETVDVAFAEMLETLSRLPAVRMLLHHQPPHDPQTLGLWAKGKAYPRKAEFYIFKQAQELLLEVCFDFFEREMPGYLRRRQVECPESFPLKEWLGFIREELSHGGIPTHRLRGERKSVAGYIDLAERIRGLRNKAAHSGLRTAEELSQRLQPGVEFALMLGDDRRARQLELLKEEFDKGIEFVEYLEDEHQPLREKEIELEVFQRILVVLLHDFRDRKAQFSNYIIEDRARLKNLWSLGRYETVLKIQSERLKEETVQKYDRKREGELSWDEWQEKKKNPQRFKYDKGPSTDSPPFEHAHRTSGQPLGLRTSWLSPDADIESKESDAPTTADADPVAAVPTTRDPDEVSPSGPAAETTEKDLVSAEPQAVSENLDDANIPIDQNSPDAPTPQHTKNSPATPAVADSKKKSAPATPTAAATAAGKESKDAKQAAPPTNDEVLDFTEFDDNQTICSSHRLK
ncbi:hypothetical protein IWX90DRAFT_487823 [Phyllosticta citrichinensis]|uniref:Uncharacterized protein n=1 Tax=Phyllosticta citrichinensis TaxID=1130410 RepID=A0ABR1XS98_9PEZI